MRQLLRFLGIFLKNIGSFKEQVHGSLIANPHLLMSSEAVEYRQPGPQVRNASHLCCGLTAIAVGNQQTALGNNPLQIFQVADIDVLSREGIKPRTLVADRAD